MTRLLEPGMSRIHILTAALLLAASIACAGNPAEPDGGPILGTVRLLPVEGGCWVIDASDGVRYEPIGLPDAFRQDGRSVSATLRQRPDLGSFCMVGRVVEVVSIQSR